MQRLWRFVHVQVSVLVISCNGYLPCCICPIMVIVLWSVYENFSPLIFLPSPEELKNISGCVNKLLVLVINVCHLNKLFSNWFKIFHAIRDLWNLLILVWQQNLMKLISIHIQLLELHTGWPQRYFYPFALHVIRFCHSQFWLFVYVSDTYIFYGNHGLCLSPWTRLYYRFSIWEKGNTS